MAEACRRALPSRQWNAWALII